MSSAPPPQPPSAPPTSPTVAPRWRLSAHLWPALTLLLFTAALAATQYLSTNLWKLSNGDVDEYQRYALAFWTQRPLAHALPVEYPPLAILPFTLTLLPALSAPYYHIIFAVWLAALVLLGYLGVLRFAGRRHAFSYALYLTIGGAATLLARYDIVPALATLAALWACQRTRFDLAYLLLALGVLLKLYPAFLLPVVFIAHWRALDPHAPTATTATTAPHATSPSAARPAPPTRLATLATLAPLATLAHLRHHPALPYVARGLAFFTILTLSGFAGAFILNPTGALTEFRYAGQRPIQIESLPATILWLGSILGVPAQPNYSYVSLNIVGPLDAALKPLSALALVLGCLWVYWRQARGRLTVGQAFVACICVVLVTNKLFSPQYIIWILPLAADVEGLDLLWLAICLLTWLDFPITYQLRHPIQTVTFTPQFMPILALRNALLLCAALRAIIRPRGDHAQPRPLARDQPQRAPATAPSPLQSTASGASGAPPQAHQAQQAPATHRHALPTSAAQ